MDPKPTSYYDLCLRSLRLGLARTSLTALNGMGPAPTPWSSQTYLKISDGTRVFELGLCLAWQGSMLLGLIV